MDSSCDENISTKCRSVEQLPRHDRSLTPSLDVSTEPLPMRRSSLNVLADKALRELQTSSVVVPRLNSSDEEDEREFWCAICLSLLRNPRQLPCGHTFCLTCLEKLTNRRKLTCPNCRGETELTSEGVKRLHVDPSIVREVRKLRDARKEKLKEKRKKTCSTCSQSSTCIVCSHCNQQLCSSCCRSHLQRVRQDVAALTATLEKYLHKEEIDTAKHNEKCKYDSDYKEEMLYGANTKRVHTTVKRALASSETFLSKTYKEKHHSTSEKPSSTLNQFQELERHARQYIFLRKVFTLVEPQFGANKNPLEYCQSNESNDLDTHKSDSSSEDNQNDSGFFSSQGSESELKGLTPGLCLTQTGSLFESLPDTTRSKPLDRQSATTEEGHAVGIHGLSSTSRDAVASFPTGIGDNLDETGPVSGQNANLLAFGRKQDDKNALQFNSSRHLAFKPDSASVEAHRCSLEDQSLFYRCKPSRCQQKLVQRAHLRRPTDVTWCHWNNTIYVTSSQFTKIIGFHCQGLGQSHQVKQPGRVEKVVWGVRGNEPGQLLCPSGIASASYFKELYVIDKWRSKVLVYTLEGEFVTEFGSKGHALGQFSAPEAIAVDSKNLLYVADTCNDRIQVLDRHGTPLGVFGSRELRQPAGIAVTPDGGLVAVADTGNHRCRLYGGAPKVLMKTLGSRGCNQGQMESPECVAFDSFGFILVGDSGNHRVQVFRPNGNFVRYFGYRPGEKGELKMVTGLTVTPALEVLVTDFTQHAVMIY